MKVILDMSALDAEKRKMVVDYLQDNEVPITWAEHINKIQDIARLPFTGWDLASGKPPVMVAPYGGGSRYSKERAVDPYKAIAEQILTQERSSLFACEQYMQQPTPFVRGARSDAEFREHITQEWAGAEARRQEGLEPKQFPKRTAATRVCPFCGAMPDYTHREGTPVCKCTTKGCAGADRWLEYEDFEALNLKPADPYTPEFRSGSPMQRQAQGLCPDCGHTIEGSLHHIGCPRLKFD